MQTVTNASFGPLIAYLVPGATALVGVSQFSPTLNNWFGAVPTNMPTIGGFLYLTVASLAAGMTVSALRWALLDTFHAWTGLRPPALDFSKLGPNVEALNLLIEIHYKHYLYYSNMAIAGAVAYVCYRVKMGGFVPLGWLDLAFVTLEAIFVGTSRDTLKKYFARSQQLLSPQSRTKRRRILGK